jgi:hypothetical protein
MFIDAYAANWFDELHARAEKLSSAHHLYLLVDGAFVPGLHKLLGEECKALLFEALPGFNEAAKDVSPFLVPFDLADKDQASLLRRCSRWPMVSLIETSEALEKLRDRLAAWCVVEVDGQRFNFRFPDTRRLKAILQALRPAQRAQLTGPAVFFSYVARDGTWADIALPGGDEEIVDRPKLDEQQFAMLVDDSRGDEILSILDHRGHAVYRTPSRSYALVGLALSAANSAGELDDSDTVQWCEWFWKTDQLKDLSDARSTLASWRKQTLSE